MLDFTLYQARIQKIFRLRQVYVEGWTLRRKLDLFVWFLWWLCKIEVLKILPQYLQGFLLLDST